MRKKSFEFFNLDIIGVAETHLHGEEEIKWNMYEWVRHNHKELHRKAKWDSGRVVLMIYKHSLQHFNYVIFDNNVEGVLWVKLSASKCDFSFSICVCYLPSEGSSRDIKPYEFYDKLITQVHECQQISVLYLW